ncbi:zinc finger protein 414, partial [Plectropomus leopardus]|uniref:zinc finger protein 414 n=1 Tax=Plectropomus leopardus TaxID=160734 RepID=UPI001C4B67FC
CESCRTKLRSYRGLLTHLHTCSKVPRGKAKPTEPAVPLPNPNETPMDVDQKPPQLDSVSTPQQPPSQIPNPDGSFPAAVLQTDSAAPPVLGPPFSSNPETAPPQLGPPQLTDAAPQPQIKTEVPNLPLPSNLDVLAAAPEPPEAQSQQHLTQTRSPEPLPPAPGSAPRSPPVTSAVWKKNQGEPLTYNLVFFPVNNNICKLFFSLIFAPMPLSRSLSDKMSKLSKEMKFPVKQQ